MTGTSPRAHRSATIPPRPVANQSSNFAEYARQVTLRHGVMSCVVFGVAALMMWPTDQLFFPGRPQVHEAFGWWRAELIVLSLLSVVGGFSLRRYPRLIYPGVAVFAFVLAASAGRALAATGGPDKAWFHTLYVVPLAIFPLSLPLVHRIATTALATSGCMTAYFLSDPSYLEYDGFPTVVVALLGTAAVATLIGHSHFRLLKTAFEQQVKLAWRTLDLEKRVAERTARLRQLTHHLERSREQERRRIGRDLHDELAQLLTAMRLELRLALRSKPELRVTLGGLDTIVDQLFESKERLVRALQPAELDALGLAGAVRTCVAEMERRSDRPIVSSIEVELPEPPADIAEAVFRMLQEGLTNAIRHAHADRIEVRLVCRDGVLRVVIEDDGRGFDPREVGDGSFGLLGVRERMEALGGELVLDSTPGRGTRFALSLPVPHHSTG